PVEVVIGITGLAMGLGVVNTFGYDGPAYATQLLAALPARLDLRARIIANGMLAVPIVVVAAVVVGLLKDDAAGVVPAIGVGLAGFGCVAGLGAVFSARMPSVPAPPEKPFSTPPGGQGPLLITAYGSLLGGL